MDRAISSSDFSRATVPTAGVGAFDLLLRTGVRKRRESDSDASPGRAVYADTFLRLATYDDLAAGARISGKSKASLEAHETDGVGGDLSQTEPLETRDRPRNLSIFAEESANHDRKPGLVDGHYIHTTNARFHLPGSHHRLVLAICTVMGGIDHDGKCVLPFRSGMGARTRSTRNIQYGPGVAIHEQGFHRQVKRRRSKNQHGWQGPSSGQCFCRATLAVGEIRRSLPAGLSNGQRGKREPQSLLRLLQSKAPAPGSRI